MPAPPDRFLDAAVQHLTENAELHFHARHEMEECIHLQSTDDPSWNTAADQLARFDRSRWMKYGQWGLLALTLLAALAILPLHFLEFQRTGFLYNQSQTNKPYLWEEGWSQGSAEADRREFGRSLSVEHRLILMGDAFRSSESQRLEALCRQFPDNPAYFADYSAAFWHDHQKLPPDYFPTAARIDPDNGWFLFFAASVTTPYVSSWSSSYSEKEEAEGVVKHWTIKDRPRLDSAMDLFGKAMALPRFESYQQSRQKEIEALLPPLTDLGSPLKRNSFLIARSSPLRWWGGLSSTLAAQAQELASSNDRQGFLLLLSNWRKFMRHAAESEDTVWGVEIFARDTLPNLIAAADKLDCQEEKTALQAGKAELAAIRKATLDSWAERDKDEIYDRVTRHGGISSGWFANVIRSDSYRDEFHTLDVNPSCMTQLAWMDGCNAVGAAIVLAFLTGIPALYRLRHRLPLRRLGDRIVKVLSPADWLWILGGGVMGPIAFEEVIYYFTPLGGRHWCAAAMQFREFRMLAELLPVVAAPILIARWRLAKRLPGMRPSFVVRKLEWLLVIIGAAGVPLSGITYVTDLAEAWVWVGWVCSGLLLLGLLVMCLRALFAKVSAAIVRQTIARTLVPAYACGALVFTLLVPLDQMAEVHWAALDPFLSVKDDSPANSLARKATDARRKEAFELLEAFSPNPEKAGK